jgi:hypothetical protein
VNGQDVVLTPDDAGSKLSASERWILNRGYAVQRLAVVVFQGPTMALVDTPAWFRCGGKNKLIRFRYALLVDATSGRLDGLVWGLDPDGGCFAAKNEAVRLEPNTLAFADLVPDLNEFKLGIPSEAAFAVEQLPPGERLVLPDGLRRLCDATRFTPDEAHALEDGLRRLLAK